MLRYFALLLLALLIWMLLRRLFAYLLPAAPPVRRTGRRSAGAARPAERLLRCEACGVRVPESRALSAGGDAVYCSEACHRQAVRDSA
ncbi:MAG TPA: PP0621 family protein [Thermoanaerobaculia bacterium]|nr:PP0621 family protein [Thermoanaerobaculia bacterium]